MRRDLTMREIVSTMIFGLALAACADKKPEAPPGGPASAPAVVAAVAKDGAREVTITVDGKGYHPAVVRAPAGSTLRLSFVRTADDGCGQQLVFPTLDVRKDLPLDEPVVVEVKVPATGTVAFSCGMDMLQGAVVVE
jgi:plastocyanin domain-containing protein